MSGLVPSRPFDRCKAMTQREAAKFEERQPCAASRATYCRAGEASGCRVVEKIREVGFTRQFHTTASSRKNRFQSSPKCLNGSRSATRDDTSAIETPRTTPRRRTDAALSSAAAPKIHNWWLCCRHLQTAPECHSAPYSVQLHTQTGGVSLDVMHNRAPVKKNQMALEGSGQPELQSAATHRWRPCSTDETAGKSLWQGLTFSARIFFESTKRRIIEINVHVHRVAWDIVRCDSLLYSGQCTAY